MCLSLGRSPGKRRPLDSDSRICLISTILETKLWPFNVKGIDLSEDLRKAPETNQSTCKVCVQCQSSISCGAELLPARHLICASKRSFGCQICTASVYNPTRFLSPELTCFLVWNQISAVIQSVKKTGTFFEPSCSKAKCKLSRPGQSGVLRISPSRQKSWKSPHHARKRREPGRMPY